MKTLRAVIDGRAELNAQERDSLFTLLSTRCSAKTKDKLRTCIDTLHVEVLHSQFKLRLGPAV